MRFSVLIYLFFLSVDVFAQDSTVHLLANSLKVANDIYLSDMNGWIFKKGNNNDYAKPDINVSGWEELKPSQISKKMADPNGKIEGWFRIKIQPDSAFVLNELNFQYVTYSDAADIYIDGKLFLSCGNTGLNGGAFKRSKEIRASFPYVLESGKIHTIAIHFVNQMPEFPLNIVTYDSYLNFDFILSNRAYKDNTAINSTYSVVWITVCIILSMLFWLLALQNPREKNLSLIAFCTTCFSLSACTYYISVVEKPSLNLLVTSESLAFISNSFIFILMLIITAKIFTDRITRFLRRLIFVMVLLDIYCLFGFYYAGIIYNITNIGGLVIISYYIITSWKKLKGSQWAIVAGLLCTAFFGTLYFLSRMFSQYNNLLLLTIAFLAFPLSLLVYISIRFNEIIREVRENATKLVQVTEEKRQQALNQQKVLEIEVEKQTSDLMHTLTGLKSAQSQLIQSEKMASLGELTAGIAHEIQNPLNFVNNFSDINSELIEEAGQEMDKGNILDAKAILNDIKENEQKINNHGKRADAIVKGMLQHSRTSTGVKEATNINSLADEFLRLAYHGFRAKEKSFNAEIKTNFDPAMGSIHVVPQDIGRVLLNLYNNAFYAVSEKMKESPDGYQPTISASIKKVNDKIEIRIRDNGNGIPDKVKDKIFQPFFTTKPTGEGTGLGLSLSYDIVNAHGGEIRVSTREGEFTEFMVQIPAV